MLEKDEAASGAHVYAEDKATAGAVDGATHKAAEDAPGGQAELDEFLLGDTDEIDPADLEPKPFRAPDRKRVLLVALPLLVLLLLVLLPPYVNVNRYQRQTVASISASLGRPVRIEKITLNLLPVPSFMLTNFVVGEDPAFGSEPVIRASSVRATIRLNSLWRRRVEFSTISLDTPSVNLVHLPDNRWNVESILLQASRVPAAPTAQKVATETPRFPYIEATDARVNIKNGLEKMPLSLTEAKFAVWLSGPDEWSVRLEGHPNRTDTAASDTGSFRLHGTLGRAATLEQVPLDLSASWTAAPLGAVSWIVLGRDLGVRGDLTATTAVKGTLGANQIQTTLTLRGVRRADFVPARSLDADVACRADGVETLHRLEKIRCTWPLAGTSNAEQTGLVVTGELPELMRPGSVDLQARWNDVPAELLLDGLRILSSKVSPRLTAEGVFSGTAACCAAPPQNEAPVALTITKAKLALGDAPPFVSGAVEGTGADGKLTFAPVALDLGGPSPAMLGMTADWSGYTLHLEGTVVRSRLLALAGALPPFGDGIEAILPEPDAKSTELPFRVDADASHTWFNAQTWTTTPVAVRTPVRRTRGRRR